MKEYADLSHLTVLELFQLKDETLKAGFEEDKDFVNWIDKEIKSRR